MCAVVEEEEGACRLRRVEVGGGVSFRRSSEMDVDGSLAGESTEDVGSVRTSSPRRSSLSDESWTSPALTRFRS